MTRPANFLLWTDLETTGGDESLDPIIEIGWVLTDGQGVKIIEMRNHLVYSPYTGDRLANNPYVRRMHEENGLTEALEGVSQEDTAPAVAVSIVKELESFGVKPHDIWIAGSGVSHFDRRFINVQMPVLDKFLAYPAIDIGVWRRMMPMMGMEKIAATVAAQRPEIKAHRAVKDALDHLHEFQEYRDEIRKRRLIVEIPVT